MKTLHRWVAFSLVAATQGRASSTECAPLPNLVRPWASVSGEKFEFTLDALGAEAGKLQMRVLPIRRSELPIEVNVKTNTFFSKFRRVTGRGVSYLSAQTLRPTRYEEDSTENGLVRSARVGFKPENRTVAVRYTQGRTGGSQTFASAADALDVTGATFLIRQLPFEENLPFCFDVYGIRKLWRLKGKVIQKEKLHLPVGEFDAWRLSGEAVRLDSSHQRRKIHLWISADERRLPLVAVGSIDLGAVRATLTFAQRPHEKALVAAPKENLKW